jgi:hypothetical protein
MWPKSSCQSSPGDTNARSLTTGYLTEEAQGADRLVVLGPGRLFLVQKKEKITMDLICPELSRGLAEVGGEIPQMEDVRFDGPGRAIAQLQLLDKTLP